MIPQRAGQEDSSDSHHSSEEREDSEAENSEAETEGGEKVPAEGETEATPANPPETAGLTQDASHEETSEPVRIEGGSAEDHKEKDDEHVDQEVSKGETGQSEGHGTVDTDKLPGSMPAVPHDGASNDGTFVYTWCEIKQYWDHIFGSMFGFLLNFTVQYRV